MIEFRTIKPQELEIWFDHCMYSFNDGENSSSKRQHFMDHWYRDPFRDIDGILVAVENGKILSSLRILNRTMFLEGHKVKIGAIGEVGTLSEYRGNGLAGRLLLNSVAWMKDREIHISMLGAVIRDYYNKFGWRQNKLFYKISDIDANSRFSYDVRPIDFNREIEAAKAIYDEYCKKFSGVFAREDSYWELWIKPQMEHCQVVEDSKHGIIAYVCFDDMDKLIDIKEFAVLPAFDGIFDELIAHIGNISGKASCEVKYPCVIKSNLKVKRLEKWPYNMFRLITPFDVGEKKVENTEQLLELINGEYDTPLIRNYLYWTNDNF